jgi:hypothetical protein
MTDTFNNQSQHAPQPQATPEPAPQGSRPLYRVYLVEDQPEGNPKWTELSGLWPTKTGTGFKGNLKTPIAATGGRIIVMPVKNETGDKPN